MRASCKPTRDAVEFRAEILRKLTPEELCRRQKNLVELVFTTGIDFLDAGTLWHSLRDMASQVDLLQQQQQQQQQQQKQWACRRKGILCLGVRLSVSPVS
jgi:hypothetical protein